MGAPYTNTDMALAIFVLLLISVVVGTLMCKYGFPGSDPPFRTGGMAFS